jgi:hypothetical protein
MYKDIEDKHGVTLAQANALLRDLMARNDAGLSILAAWGASVDRAIKLESDKAKLREALQSLVDWGNTLPDIASEKQRAEYAADYARAVSVLSALPNV